MNAGLNNLNITNLYYNNNILYACTGGGIYKSSNDGVNWQQIGLSNQIIYSFTSNSTNLFSGTTSGVFTTSNNGVTWGLVNNSFLSYRVNDILIKDGYKIFAGTRGGGNFISTNSGDNWISRNEGFGYKEIYSYYTYGNNIYCGTTWEGLYSSSNEGTNWSRIDNGFANSYVTSILSIGGNLFAGTLGAGIYYSTNNGANWVTRNTGLTSLSIRSIKNRSNSLYVGTDGGGVYISNDNGLNWSPINSGLSDLFLQQIEIKDNYIFAASYNTGIYRTSNNGISWQVINNGITDMHINYIDVSKNLISACSFPGSLSGWVYISTNNGNNWTVVNTSVPEMAPISVKNSIGYIYAGSINSSVWKYSLSGLIPLPVPVNLVSPSNNSTNQSLTPLLDWDSIPPAMSYQIQISTNSGFSFIVIDTSGIINSSINVPSGKLNIGVMYYWRVRAGNEGGYGNWSNIWNFTTTTTSIVQIAGKIPTKYALLQNYPNPFNPTTRIKYDLPKNSFVTIVIYDILGKEIKTLVNEHLSSGTYETNWDASKYSSGIYFYRLQAGDFTETKRMTVIK
jgi:photosystem II stability/assembly factor-like uncharacterized protein